MDKQDRKDDIEDLDAFLKDEGSTTIRNLRLDRELMELRSASDLPLTADPLKRIDHRITHAFRSIETARKNRESLSKAIEEDEQFSSDFSGVTQAWEALFNKLEQIFTTEPEKQKEHAGDKTSSQEPESIEFDLADEVASHLDTLVQEAYEAEQTAGRDARPPATGTDEPAVETEARQDTQDELKRSLEEREARILELESQLEELKTGSSATEEYPFVNRLFVVTSNGRNLKYPLTKQIMTVGREPENDIHIRSKYISRFHARIVCDQDGTVIEDLDSRNGITVNSRRVRRKQLRSGDLIDIGRVQFKYIDLMEGSPGEGSA